MNIEGFDLEDKEIRTLEKSLTSLEKHFLVEVIDCDKISGLFDFIDHLRSFQLLNHYKDFEIINVFNLNPDKENIKIVNLYLSYMSVGQRGQVNEFGDIYNIGYLELPVDFGSCLITPETTADKILDFFLRREVDFFENKDFCENFYVLGTNKDLVRKKLSYGIQQQLMKFPKINIEIQNNKLIATFQKRMTIKETTGIAQILKKIKNEISEA